MQSALGHMQKSLKISTLKKVRRKKLTRFRAFVLFNPLLAIAIHPSHAKPPGAVCPAREGRQVNGGWFVLPPGTQRPPLCFSPLLYTPPAIQRNLRPNQLLNPKKVRGERGRIYTGLCEGGTTSTLYFPPRNEKDTFGSEAELGLSTSNWAIPSKPF